MNNNQLISFQCIHKDLRTKHILVTSDYILKISDYTVSKAGPLKWQAPETILNGDFNKQSIIWTYGVVLWEIFSFGDSPFPYLVPEVLYQHLQSGNRLEKPEKCSIGAYNLMKKCWDFDRENRPTFEEIFGILNSLMMEMNGGYVRMNSTACEKQKSSFKNSINKVYPNCQPEKSHQYVNLKSTLVSLHEDKSHYVNMTGKLKPFANET